MDVTKVEAFPGTSEAEDVNVVMETVKKNVTLAVEESLNDIVSVMNEVTVSDGSDNPISPDMKSKDVKKEQVSVQKDQEPSIVTVADKIVHLFPIEMPDGTIEYKFVSLDEQGQLTVETVQGYAGLAVEADTIYMDKSADVDTFLAATTKPNPSS